MAKLLLFYLYIVCLFFLLQFYTIEEDEEEKRSLFVSGDSHGDAEFAEGAEIAFAKRRLPRDFPVSGGLKGSSGIGRLQTAWKIGGGGFEGKLGDSESIVRP